MTRLLVVLAVCAGCATMPVVDHNNAYSESGRWPGSVVARSVMGSAINVASPSTILPSLTVSGAGSFAGGLLVRGSGNFSVGSAGSQFFGVTSGGTVSIDNGAALTISSGSSLRLVSGVAMSGTTPTISSGFGSSPTIASANGSLTFQVNVGTGGVATSGVVGLPASSTGWTCVCTDLTTPSSTTKTFMTANSVSTCTLTNQTVSTGAAVAWAASAKLWCVATGQ